MVTAITGLGQAFADLGLSEATIQHPEINHDQVSKLFWLNVAIGLALTTITASLAPFLAWFYHEPRLKAISYVVSFTFLIGGLRVQHDALLRRNMRFMALAIRDVVAYALAVPAAILLAWRGAGYWAIVALPLTLITTQMVLSWMMAGWIPGIPRRCVRIRSLITFGGNVAVSYLISTLARSADNILIGWDWGAAPLGLYSRAYNLLMLPVRQLGTPARSVAVPAFSRVQSDPERLARYYLQTINLIMWITAPLFGFLFVAAEPVIVLTLGARWRDAAPVFQLLAIAALGQLLLDSTTWLYVSRGKSLDLLRLWLVLTPIMVASYAVGLPFGIKGVALSGSLVLLMVFPGILKFSFCGTQLALHQLIEKLMYPVITGLAGVTTGELASREVTHLSAIAQIAIVAVAFTGGCLLAAVIRPVREEMKDLKNLLRNARAMSSPQLVENLN